MALYDAGEIRGLFFLLQTELGNDGKIAETGEGERLDRRGKSDCDDLGGGDRKKV